MNSRSFRYAFFDLDGTLTQSGFGIINSVLYALNHLGYEVRDRESVKRFIGPPLKLAFQEFCQMPDEDADKAVRYYRECYNAGEMYNAPLYEGVREMLQHLAQEGVILYVVTSKPVFFAAKIVEHFGISEYFRKIIGPELSDVNYSKEELIHRAMSDVWEITDSQGTDDRFPEALKQQCIMVGDRKYDIEGAVRNGIVSIGVLYGYGTKTELENAGASYLADDVVQVEQIILNPEEYHKPAV